MYFWAIDFVSLVMGIAICRMEGIKHSPGDIYWSPRQMTQGPLLIVCRTIDIYVNERIAMMRREVYMYIPPFHPFMQRSLTKWSGLEIRTVSLSLYLSITHSLHPLMGFRPSKDIHRRLLFNLKKKKRNYLEGWISG